MLNEDYLHYSDSYAAVTRFRGEISPKELVSPDAPVSSLKYFPGVVCEAYWDLAYLNVDGQPPPRTTLKAKLVDLQSACRRAHHPVPCLLREVVDLTRESVRVMPGSGTTTSCPLLPNADATVTPTTF